MVTSTTITAFGGAERVIRDLALELSVRGIQVILVTSANRGNLNPRVEHLPLLSFRGPLGFVLSTFRLIWLMLSKRHSLDVVHAHYMFPPGVICLFGKLLGKPVIVTSHGYDIQRNRRMNYGTRLNPFYAALIWFGSKLVDCHVVVSGALVKDAVASGTPRRKIVVIHNGIDLKNIPSDLESAEHLSKTICWLGRLHAKKDPLLALRIFRLVLNQQPNCKLVMIGKGPLNKELRNLAKQLALGQSLHMLGECTDEEKWAFLSSSSVFLMTSRLEAFGVALIEAMAAGVPCVVVNKPPFDEIVENGVTGILAGPSPEALAKEVLRVLETPSVGRALGKAARERVRKMFTVTSMGSAYISLYRSVLSEGLQQPLLAT